MTCRLTACIAVVVLSSSLKVSAGELIVGVGYSGTQNLSGSIGLSKDGGKTFKDVWYHSTDGSTEWTIKRVRYFPATKKFIAVGPVGMLTSSDGETWTLVKLPKLVTRGLNDVAYGNGVYVAVGDSTTILTSTDAVTWTHPLQNDKGEMDLQKYSTYGEPWSDNNGRYHYKAVLFVPPNFLATGSDQRSLRFTVSDTGAFAFVDKVVNNPGPANDGLALVGDAKKLIILGNAMWQSEDGGATWKEKRGFKPNYLCSGVVSGKGYVFGTQYGDIMTSDGTTLVSAGRITEYPVDDLYFTGKKFFATDRAPNKLMTSIDGKKWTELKFTTESEEPNFQMTFYSVIAVNR